MEGLGFEWEEFSVDDPQIAQYLTLGAVLEEIKSREDSVKKLLINGTILYLADNPDLDNALENYFNGQSSFSIFYSAEM